MQVSADIAIIPDFMRFQVLQTELWLAPTYANYDVLQRGVSAAIVSAKNHLISSDKMLLDQCEGELHISSNDDVDKDWTGRIHRFQPFEHSTIGHRKVDYGVYIEMRPSAFEGLMTMVQTGQQLFGLLLDFQNIDSPPQEEWREDDLWDDIAYPRVALTSFLLRWKPPGGAELSSYLWP